MNPFPTHVDLLIGPYVLNALDDLERATVERHLRTCPSCAAEAAELTETAARLGTAEAAAPPPGLRARALAAARATPQQAGPPVSHRRRQRLLSAAAVAVLFVGAVGTTFELGQHRVEAEHAKVVAAQAQTTRMQAVLSAPDARIRVAGDAPSGRLTAVYSPSHEAAWFSFGGLDGTPSGRTYQLWRVAGGIATSLGVLPPGQTSGSLLVDQVTATDALAISVEKAGGARTPTAVYAKLALS